MKAHRIWDEEQAVKKPINARLSIKKQLKSAMLTSVQGGHSRSLGSEPVWVHVTRGS